MCSGPHRLFSGEDAGGEWDGEKVAASFLGAYEAAQGVGMAGSMHQSWAQCIGRRVQEKQHVAWPMKR